MAVVIGSNFSYKGEEPNFARDSFKTLAEMKAFPDTSLDEGHVSYCQETGKRYEFKKSNSIDPVTGKWRLTIDTALDAHSENPVQNKVIVEKLNTENSNFSESLDNVKKELKKNIDDNKLATETTFKQMETTFEESSEVVSAALNDLKVSKADTNITINGHELGEGEIELNKSEIGLGNVDNTSDINKPVSTAQQAELNKKVDKKDGFSLISDANTTKLNNLPTNEGLTSTLGGITNSIDNHKNNKDNPHNVTPTQLGLASWVEYTPTTAPVSEPQQTALDKKVNKTLTINKHSLENNVEITKLDVGLGRVDNTTDLEKPISTAVQKEIDKLYGIMYKQHASVSIWSNISGNIIEKGIAKSVTLSWNYIFNGVSDTPETLQLVSGESILVSDKNTKTFTESISDTKKYIVKSVNKGEKKDASVTISAYYPKYFGGSSKSKDLTSSDITGFNKQKISSGVSGEYSFTVKQGDYVWLCVPSGMTITSVSSNGFGVAMEGSVTRTVDGKGSYNCYRSSGTLNAGTFKCNIK